MEEIVEEFKTDFHGPRKVYFITWPQSTNKMDYKQVYETFDDEKVTHRIVCKEYHKDGGEHIHAMVIFAGKGISKSMLLKFCQSEWPQISNVHVRKARSPWHAWEYCKKDGCYIQSSENPIRMSKKSKSIRELSKRIKSYSAFDKLIALDNSKDYLWNLINELSPLLHSYKKTKFV